ncbi:hypothetical protein [Furfurilactobacillus cerevisiae]|uniref:hypothetical protein n=1 Tax=Furfurilactobacillus rossiae TaxID=231049 RepID=UPI003B9845E4
MSSTNQTHKRYLQEADGTVYWPITAWDAVVGKPDGLVDKPALDAAIAGIQKPNLSGYLTQASLAGYVVKSELPDFTKFAMKTDLPTFDPNTVYTKDEVNNYVSQSVQNSLSTFLNGDYAKAIAQLKELSDALSGDHSVLAGLLTQLSNKANVGDSYLKSEEDAKFATKGEVSVAINGLNKFDPNKVFTKDEVNAAIVKAIGDLQDKIYGGDVNAALDTIKELQDAYNGSNTIIQRLLTQLGNKANVGDSFTKDEAKATFATIATVQTAIDGRLPAIDSNFAMQILMEGLKVTPNFTTGHLDYETTPTTDSTITGAMMNLYLTKISFREDEKGHLITEVTF